MILKIALACTALALALAGPAHAQPADTAVQRAAASQKQPLLDTLKEFVSIETGSRDAAGLTKATELLASRLRALGGQVEFVEPTDATTYRMADTPGKIGRMVKASFRGTGSKRILLLAHMDTVYPQGMLARQPFRIDGDKAYGLGIADDKQGVALVVHIVALLKQLNFNEYGELTVLVNSDEEISSPGSREAIAAAGAAHDVTMSFESSRAASDKLSLATAGIGSVQLKVEGKASHAGLAPEQGVNALYELSHQLLQMRDLSDPQTGLKLNWTISQAGTNRNVIPAQATAEADVRVLRVADYDRIEAVVRERAKKQLLPESKVTVSFERRRPPLETSDASRKLAAQAQAIYREIGKDLVVDPVAEGGGTDAAFAALKTKNAVVERFGLQGFGAHSTDAEYILLGSIEPRLYLAARLIMDVSRGRAQ
ncbi:M20/M25/M40 family metallo-hydrolase [Ramlibacter sp. MAH-25]|uniref:M20/M25/M40 family metallo-hydrolase n=1 Tax=Ramlibacter pinisoli TaxID=2682844 RepID=A0A6N8IXD4_9BURK|nr:M20/M25/M40 family metallo-hydrolase [Ramlibacter sp. CGMCC 1.13660]MVQ31634.1 M20/M25/M40 family metallo-hydrolase [Ramlibacter pinisoli]